MGQFSTSQKMLRRTGGGRCCRGVTVVAYTTADFLRLPCSHLVLRGSSGQRVCVCPPQPYAGLVFAAEVNRTAVLPRLRMGSRAVEFGCVGCTGCMSMRDDTWLLASLWHGSR